MQERAFAHTRGAHDGEHLALAYLQVDPGQDVERFCSTLKILAELMYIDQRSVYFFSPGVTDSIPFSTFFSRDAAFSSTVCLMLSACFPAPSSFFPADLNSLPPPARTNTMAMSASRMIVIIVFFKVPPFCAIEASSYGYTT